MAGRCIRDIHPDLASDRGRSNSERYLTISRSQELWGSTSRHWKYPGISEQSEWLSEPTQKSPAASELLRRKCKFFQIEFHPLPVVVSAWCWYFGRTRRKRRKAKQAKWT
jgi:hypothetical protein